jgi:hypothetical protein
LLESFRLRALATNLGLTRICHRGDVYVLEFKDRVALEHALAGSKVDFRPIRTGVAHLVIPPRHREPLASARWLDQLLAGPRAGAAR